MRGWRNVWSQLMLLFWPWTLQPSYLEAQTVSLSQLLTKQLVTEKLLNAVIRLIIKTELISLVFNNNQPNIQHTTKVIVIFYYHLKTKHKMFQCSYKHLHQLFGPQEVAWADIDSYVSHDQSHITQLNVWARDDDVPSTKTYLKTHKTYIVLSLFSETLIIFCSLIYAFSSNNDLCPNDPCGGRRLHPWAS